MEAWAGWVGSLSSESLAKMFLISMRGVSSYPDKVGGSCVRGSPGRLDPQPEQGSSHRVLVNKYLGFKHILGYSICSYHYFKRGCMIF